MFKITMVYIMIKNIRTVLTPLLIISYVNGLRIMEFPKGYPRIWFSLLYMLIFWSIYFYLLMPTTFHYLPFKYYKTTHYFICFGLQILITLLSIVSQVYHDKKFRNCLRKLDIVDNTLLNIGTTTDYHKLLKQIIYAVLGWYSIFILMSYGTGYCIKNEYINDAYTLTVMSAFLIRNYCYVINMITDLIVASTFGYIGLKFDQVNQHLLNLITYNNRGIKRAWENSMHQQRFLQASSKRWMIWVIIHLHAELRKISCEVDTIFGVHMTLNMGCIFFWLTYDLREYFSVILIKNHITSNKMLFIILWSIWLSFNGLRLFFINYVCETVSTKANTTGNLINEMLYSTFDVEVRENTSQLLLQITQAPVKFYGIGFFQYGYKFFYGFSSSITTVVVLLIQGYINKQTFYDD